MTPSCPFCNQSLKDTFFPNDLSRASATCSCLNTLLLNFQKHPLDKTWNIHKCAFYIRDHLYHVNFINQTLTRENHPNEMFRDYSKTITKFNDFNHLKRIINIHGLFQ